MKALAIAAIATIALALAGSASATPTPVLLGDAGIFALLAGSGLTNTGVTTVGGDVGSSPTPSQTGFTLCPAADCVALTGTNHTDPAPNDTATQNGKAALATAYGVAAGQTPTTVVTELGGQTLTAGVYDSASGTFGMTGTLVLDGANNADSIFIFQTASTLTTGGTGNVSFIRGAQACNVFWKVGSAATLGAGSSFSGTILAHDDISVGNGVTVSGRLLAGAAGAGAVTLIHDTITKPASCVTQASIDAAALAVSQAAAAAAAAAAAKAAAAVQAAADAQAAADRAAAAAREADAKAAAEAAAKATAAAAQAAAAAKAAAAAAAAAAQAAAKATADQAAAVAAKATAAKVAAVKAAAAARTAKAAAAKARTAKAHAISTAIARKRASVRAPHARAGFTG